MNDITNKKDIAHFVNSFYQEVNKDDLLGPVFRSKISAEAWPEHLEKMQRFWNTVLFGVIDYRGNPFSHHIGLKIENAHFERWMNLFNNVMATNFVGPKATEASFKAGNIRMMFESKMDNINS